MCKEEIVLLNSCSYYGFDAVEFPVRVEGTPVTRHDGEVVGWDVSYDELVRIGAESWVTGEEGAGCLYFSRDRCAVKRLNTLKHLPEVSRVEIIDHRFDADCKGIEWCKGRNVIVLPTEEDISVSLSFQDEGQTLKIFIDNKGDD